MGHYLTRAKILKNGRLSARKRGPEKHTPVIFKKSVIKYQVFSLFWYTIHDDSPKTTIYKANLKCRVFLLFAKKRLGGREKNFMSEKN